MEGVNKQKTWSDLGRPRPTVGFMLEDEWSQVPTRATPGSVGYDLKANLLSMETFTLLGVGRVAKGRGPAQRGARNWITLDPGARAVISSGVRIKCPVGYYPRVAPCSGLTINKGLDVCAGVIDVDYAGVVGVVLANNGVVPQTIKHGDKIAQVVIEAYLIEEEVEVYNELGQLIDPETRPLKEERGHGGFGSTDFPTTDPQVGEMTIAVPSTSAGDYDIPYYRVRWNHLNSRALYEYYFWPLILWQVMRALRSSSLLRRGKL